MTVEIRPLAEEDPRVVLALWERAGLSHRPLGRDHPDRLGPELRRGAELSLGAYLDGELVGTVLATDDGRKGWINRLAVDPAHRRRGIGEQLLRAAESALRARGRRVIGALIEAFNDASLALFEGAGFRPHPDIHYLTKRQSKHD